MPIYEFRCRECGELTEVMQRIDDPPLAACPACGGEVKKLISAPAFQFKGSGWYVTDYARSGAKPEVEGSQGKPEAKADGASGGGVRDEKAGEKAAEKTATKTAAGPSAGE